MAIENPKQCQNVSCKCGTKEGNHCGDYCKEFDPQDDRHCGCGHMACDATGEMGNEQTFAATGS